MNIYTVKENDSLDTIANQFNTSSEKIAYDNQIPYPYSLAIGQSILINSNVAERIDKTIYSGGYAYPFINPWVLENTLPFLSDLFIFSYGFTTDGELIPPQIDERWMINMSKNFNTRPILTLTPFGSDGKFNNSLISAVINNPAAMENLKNNLIARINLYGYQGVDIDFEFILAEDRDAFSSFVAYITENIHSIGYLVSVALAPKTSASQKGLLYEGKDYGALGASADFVLLMTYEWGYKYGPPMAVAPINKVRQVLDYAITEIPSEKIHLGLPNYGYDWTLPYIKEESEAVTIGNIEAVQIAINNNAIINFDDIAKSPFFEYTSSNSFSTENNLLYPPNTPYPNTVQHQVWFEDVRSYNEKFNLLTEYNLRGLSCWQINQLFLAGWLLLNNRFYIENK